MFLLFNFVLFIKRDISDNWFSTCTSAGWLMALNLLDDKAEFPDAEETLVDHLFNTAFLYSFSSKSKLSVSL